MQSLQHRIEFKYLNDKNKYKSSIISKINNLKDIFNDPTDFKNLKNEIIKFLKEKKSIIVNIKDNNYSIISNFEEQLTNKKEDISESDGNSYSSDNFSQIEKISSEPHEVTSSDPHEVASSEPHEDASSEPHEDSTSTLNVTSINFDENLHSDIVPETFTKSVKLPSKQALLEDTEIIEYISVYSSDEEDLDNENYRKKIDTQTYFIDSDSEDESIFSQKKDKNKLSKKILNNMTILELKNIMREKNLKLSEYGIPLKKQDMIKNILKNK